MPNIDIYQFGILRRQFRFRHQEIAFRYCLYFTVNNKGL